MCQSHTGRLTGLWFLPKPAFGLNTNDDDERQMIQNLLSEFNHLIPDVISSHNGAQTQVWFSSVTDIYLQNYKLASA